MMQFQAKINLSNIIYFPNRHKVCESMLRRITYTNNDCITADILSSQGDQ